MVKLLGGEVSWASIEHMQACKYPADANARKKMRFIAGLASTHDGGDMHVGGTVMFRPRNGEGGRFVLHMASTLRDETGMRRTRP
jgi:hypothetical protein